ncbi:MAG: Fe-S cluster assembly transcriptional regulator IscR, partial [Thiothrix lacustris]
MDLSNQIRVFLSEITLADMTAKMEVQATAARQNDKRIDFRAHHSHSH